MMDNLNSFEKKWIELESLIKILMSSYRDLMLCEEQWRDSFSKEINVLKMVNVKNDDKNLVENIFEMNKEDIEKLTIE